MQHQRHETKTTQLNDASFNRAHTMNTAISASAVSISTVEGNALINKVSFTVHPGSVMTVIGDEGVGKSTLLKALAGIEQPHVKISGDIRIESAGYLAQSLPPTWHDVDVYEFFFKNVAEDAFDTASWNDYSEVVAAIAEVGLDPDLFLDGNRTMGTLSGGETTRISLAKLLMQGKRCLLLDEPTNHLDLRSIEWLEKFLESYSGPVVVVSHDEAFLERVASDVLYLQKQLPGKECPISRQSGEGYVAFMESFERESQKSLQDLASFSKEQKQLKTKINEDRISSASKARKQKPEDAATKGRQMRGLAKATQQQTQLQRKYDSAVKPSTVLVDEGINVHSETLRSMAAGKEVLNLQLPCLAANERMLATNISLRITGSEKVVIVGENGSGKSTLLQIINEQIEAGVTPGVVAKYLKQNHLKDLATIELTPLEYLSSYGYAPTALRQTLAQLNLGALDVSRPISSLSGGQIAKVMIASILLSQANLLLLDEPTNNLYPLSNRELRRFIAGFGGAVIAVSHDRKFINEVADRTLELTVQGLIDVSSSSSH